MVAPRRPSEASRVRRCGRPARRLPPRRVPSAAARLLTARGSRPRGAPDRRPIDQPGRLPEALQLGRSRRPRTGRASEHGGRQPDPGRSAPARSRRRSRRPTAGAPDRRRSAAAGRAPQTIPRSPGGRRRAASCPGPRSGRRPGWRRARQDRLDPGGVGATAGDRQRQVRPVRRRRAAGGGRRGRASRSAASAPIATAAGSWTSISGQPAAASARRTALRAVARASVVGRSPARPAIPAASPGACTARGRPA